MKKNNFEEGRILLIDKPLGWTSFDVVKKIRNTIRVKKVGHAGTLDPLATGLLILCTGKYTKKIGCIMADEKEYSGTFTIGSVTKTYDLESEPENFKSIDEITLQYLIQKKKLFMGEILQTPPAFSAVKQHGQPVYLKARRGIKVELEPRKVIIKDFVISDFKPPVVTFRVVCSTGTYIRSLADDFGRALGCGAYLSSLRRTRIGSYRVEDAMQMPDVVEELRREMQSERSE